MELILVLAIVVFLSVTVCLWYLSKGHSTDLRLETSFAPKQIFAVSLVSRFSTKRNTWRIARISRSFGELLRMLTRYSRATLIALVLSVAGCSLLVIRGYGAWVVLIILTLILLTLVITLLWSPKVCLLKKTGIEYSGKLTAPSRVYEGDSHTVSIKLQRCLETVPDPSRPIRIQDTNGGKSIVMQFGPDSDPEQCLEIELLAAGCTVDGEKKQRQPLTSGIIWPAEKLTYQWNCYFPNSGNHKLGLIARLVNVSGTVQLGSVEHNIKVVKLDHLTQRQVWLLASLAAVISGGLAIVEVLHRLGVW